MKTKTQKLMSWFKGLFKKSYLDLSILHQLKEKGITPLFLYSPKAELKEDCFIESILEGQE